MNLRSLLASLWLDGFTTLPARAWPGCYAIAYIVDDGEYLCAGCAMSDGHISDSDVDNDGFRLIGYVTADTHDYGDGPWTCAQCNVEIDPDPATFDDAEIEAILASFLDCALWAGLDWTRCSHCHEQRLDSAGHCETEGCTGYNPDQLDNHYDVDDVSDAAREELREDVRQFVNDTQNASDLRSNEPWSNDLGQIGHDFYLTRNRHGAGFWDRNYGENEAARAGDRLAEAARIYSTSELHPDDGTLFLTH